jgi:hypothetical protein
MATTSPARIDDDLYASAKLAGEVQSRSASQQVVHWARIGREIEASASISQRDIAEVLAGSRSYDTLNAKEQAFIRAEWSARMDILRESLNVAKQFVGTGRSWVELNEDGAIVERGEVRTDGAAVEGRQVEDEQTAKRDRIGRGRKVVNNGNAGEVLAGGARGTAVGNPGEASGQRGVRFAG